MKAVRVVMAVVLGAAGSCASWGQATYRSAEECREVFRSESKRWQDAYSRQMRCWGESRCGNPGADPQLKEWARRNSALLEDCERLSSAELQRRLDDERREREYRAERERQQAEAYARARQGTPQSAPRVTTIPYAPPSAATQSNNAKAAKAARDSAAIGALGNLMMEMLKDKKGDEDEGEEDVAAVAPTPTRPSRVDLAEDQVRQNNERAWKLFEKARDALKYHEAVTAIQDFAWDRLNEQVDRTFRELQTLEQQVDAIVNDVPSLEAVVTRAATTSKKVTIFETQYDYVGDLNAGGEPHGWGVARRKDGKAQSSESLYYGQFENGFAHGLGTWEEPVADDGTRAKFQGRYKNGKEVGPFAEIVTKNGVLQVERRGQYNNKSGGIARVKWPDRYEWAGPVDSNFEPSGFGTVKTPGGTLIRGRYEDFKWPKGGVEIRLGANATIHCLGQVRLENHFPRCYDGYSRWTSSSFTSASKIVEGKVVYPSVIAGLKNGQGQPKYIRETFSRIDDTRTLGRMTWDDGRVYEGEFHVNEIKGSVGRMVLPSGLTHVGKFTGTDLIDGIVVDANGGVVSTVGPGTRYDPPRVATR